MIRKHAYYSGRVQGVGFRYTTARMAANYSVNGFVRNMMNGRVEIVVEGEKSEAQAFLDAVTEEMNDYIRDTRIIDETDADADKFTGFDIRF
jgi:acylphosphatase